MSSGDPLRRGEHPHVRHARVKATLGESRQRGERRLPQTASGVRKAWARSPRALWLRATMSAALRNPWAGLGVLLGGTVAITLFIAGVNRELVPLPNPGVLYLPLMAMLAYYWGWVYGAGSAALLVGCVYYFFIRPDTALKPLDGQSAEQLGILVAVSVYVLMLAQLARTRRARAEREAARFAALNQVGIAVAGELDEARLLDLIARTAREVTGAQFAAFSLRPLDRLGMPLVPSEGNFFELAAVVGVTREQEALFRRMPLGGEGLLAPIFRYGRPVLVTDALEHVGAFHAGAFHAGAFDGGEQRQVDHEAVQAVATAFARGEASSADLRSLGVPRGHPLVRSFLGAPLLNSRGEVRGGLLLGHAQPRRFTPEDQLLLVGLAAQASVALENARLYRAAQMQAEELDAVFESIGDGITLVDAEGHIVRENEASTQLRGALSRTGDGQDAEGILRDAVASVRAEEASALVSVEVVGSDHDRHTYAVSAAPVRPPADAGAGEDDSAGGKSPGTVVVWHDVTQTQRLLEEQRRREDADARRALLQTVLDELPSAVCLVRGEDGRLVLTNRACADVWGAQWPVGMPMLEFLRQSGTRILAPDGRELAPGETATLRALHSGRDVRHFEEVIKQPNGISLPILSNAIVVDVRSLEMADSGLETASHNEPAALLVLQDVTALKDAERLKDEFIGIAAHELRTPMAALRGFAEMLVRQTARGKGAPLDAWQQEAVEAIDQATSRLVDLTDDLLDVTRLQGGRLELRPEPADLVALVRRVAGRARMTSPGRCIEVVTRSEHAVVNMDVARIEQVVTNLLNNAIKYSPAGGEVTMLVKESTDTGMACLRVGDQGIGIPAEQQSRIFGRFERAENAKRDGITGTGLGLYLCRELVERHDGRIWFESEEGKGSTFFVELPTLREEGPDEAEQMAAEDGMRPGTTGPADQPAALVDGTGVRSTEVGA